MFRVIDELQIKLTKPGLMASKTPRFVPQAASGKAEPLMARSTLKPFKKSIKPFGSSMNTMEPKFNTPGCVII